LVEELSSEKRFHASGVAMGSRNVVAGDIIGHHEEISVSGNATIIKNKDESRQLRHCAVCGKTGLVIDGHVCRSCGEWVCSKHIGGKEFSCLKCQQASLAEAEETYLRRYESAICDNQISAGECVELEALALRLGLTAEQIQKIEQRVKSEIIARALKMDRRDKRRLETARDLILRDGDAEKALKLLEPLYCDFAEDKDVRELYLLALSEVDEVRARSLIAHIRYDDLSKHLVQIHLMACNGDLDGAYRVLKLAKVTFGEDNPVLIAKDAELSLDEFQNTGNRICLDDAKGLLAQLPENHDDAYLRAVFAYHSYCEGDRNALCAEERDDKSKGVYSFYLERKLRQLTVKFCGQCGSKLGLERFCGQCGYANQVSLPQDQPSTQVSYPEANNDQGKPSGESSVNGNRYQYCGNCGAKVAGIDVCCECGSPVLPAKPGAASGTRSFAGLFVGNPHSYFEAEEVDLRQLYAYVRHAPHVTSNRQYEATAEKTILIIAPHDDSINAYAMHESGENPQVHMLGGAVSFARLCGALRETVGKQNLHDFARIWSMVGKALQKQGGSLNPEQALALLDEAGGAGFWRDEAVIRAGMEHAAGMIMVIMAHELGHLALGHTLGRPSNLEVSRNMEREADSFASSVISSSHMSMKPIEGMILWEIAWAWSDSGLRSRQATSHPLWRERLHDFVRANETIASKLGVTLATLKQILPPVK
jgi:hypothetical protein